MYVPTKIFFTKGVECTRRSSSPSRNRPPQRQDRKVQPRPRLQHLPAEVQGRLPGEGAPLLAAGQIIHCVLAEQATCEPNRLIVSSVGLAMPSDT